jgi:hypothetical protein
LTNSTFNAFSGTTVAINGAFSQDVNSTFVLGGSGTGSASVAAADFSNQGLFIINSNATATFTGTASNTGTVEVMAGGRLDVPKSAFRTVGSNVYTQTAGLTKVLTGGVFSAAAFDLEGGTLGGGGTIIGNVIVTGGSVVPGDPMTMDVTGDFTLDSGGAVVLEIDGTGAGQFDSLDITGNVFLNGGSLDIVFGNGFTPLTGEVWDILSFTGTESGMFGDVVFQNAGDLQFSEVFNGQSFELTAQTASPSPEPSTLSMLLAAFAGIAVLALRRRKQS